MLQLVQATQVHSSWHPLKEACHSLEHQHQGSDALYCLHRHPHTGDIAHTHIPIKENKSLRSVSQVAVFGNHYSSFRLPFLQQVFPFTKAKGPSVDCTHLSAIPTLAGPQDLGFHSVFHLLREMFAGLLISRKVQCLKACLVTVLEWRSI